ncbi:unnamed protein product [Somion occarium]|uniref:Cytochrome P450 n=1 Tax=Somion occarium TaxID=3059160 RepID=A0ABP1E075_9APHY
MGNLREMHDQENNNLVARWTAAYGHTFVYRGFVGGYRLMTTDPLAVSHILGHAYDFPKPDFIRDALAEMAAGHDGLLTVEGDDHRRQRKILTPAFSASHIKTLSPIFYKKASQLRDIWLDIINTQPPDTLTTNPSSSPSSTCSIGSPPSSPSDPLVVQPSSPIQSQPCGSPVRTTLPLGTSSFLPNPFSGFKPSKSVPTPPSPSSSSRHSASGVLLTNGAGLRPRKAKAGTKVKVVDLENALATSDTTLSLSSSFPTQATSDSDLSYSKEVSTATAEPKLQSRGPRVDVLAWLARATLDVIGEAGFGYTFDSLGIASRSLRRGRRIRRSHPKSIARVAYPSPLSHSSASSSPAVSPSTDTTIETPVDQQAGESEDQSDSDDDDDGPQWEGEEEENELARAFGIIFSTARQFRVFTILQVWFPILRRFKRNNATMQHAQATMRRIGLDLITKRQEDVIASSFPSSLKEGKLDKEEELDERTKGRDLLSVLICSNASPTLPPTHRLTLPETLSQISTFLAAGHETTSSALTWTLYALAKDEKGREVQRELRRVLRTIDIPDCFDPTKSTGTTADCEGEDHFAGVLGNAYLDAVVRESLRIHAPVTSTMRVALRDSVIPLSSPVLFSSPPPSHRSSIAHSPPPPLSSSSPLSSSTASSSPPSSIHSFAPPPPALSNSTPRPGPHFIQLNKGDIISIPIQAINKSQAVWGEDADEFRPERWFTPFSSHGKDNSTYTSCGGSASSSSSSFSGSKGVHVQGLWGNLLTFLNGNPINGNRACIGYRFAINEIKIFLYVLLRDIEFSLDEEVEIEKKVKCVVFAFSPSNVESHLLSLEMVTCSFSIFFFPSVVTRPCVKSEPQLGNQMPLRMRYVPLDEH